LASVLGVYAGLLGAAHGFLEILQGSVATAGFMISAIGPPCQAETIWHGCFPAVTLVPNFQVTGILALAVSLAVAVWAALFVGRKWGGPVLIALALLMLPVGGGIIPVVIGVVAGAAGTRIHTPPDRLAARLSGRSLGALAKLWPWSLVAYFLWIPSQYALGTLFNDFMSKLSFPALLLEFALLMLAILSASAYDIKKTTGSRQADVAGV
jgi:hypothetical protein